MIDVMNVRTSVNFSTLFSYRTDALPKKYASGFQLGLLNKRCGHYQGAVGEDGIRTEMPELILRYFRQGLEELGDKC